jgi:hypothetical protein
VEVHHALWKMSSQLIDAQYQCFEMITILDSGVFGNFFQPFAIKANQITRKIV